MWQGLWTCGSQVPGGDDGKSPRTLALPRVHENASSVAYRTRSFSNIRGGATTTRRIRSTRSNQGMNVGTRETRDRRLIRHSVRSMSDESYCTVAEAPSLGLTSVPLQTTCLCPFCSRRERFRARSTNLAAGVRLYEETVISTSMRKT